jgi:hypothetical protein
VLLGQQHSLCGLGNYARPPPTWPRRLGPEIHVVTLGCTFPFAGSGSGDSEELINIHGWSASISLEVSQTFETGEDDPPREL